MLDLEKIEFIQMDENTDKTISVFYISKVLEDFICDDCKSKRPRVYVPATKNSYSSNSLSISQYLCDFCLRERMKKYPGLIITRIPIQDYKGFKFETKMVIE